MNKHPLDKLMNRLSLLVLVGSVVFLAGYWKQIPAEVPMHYNAAGGDRPLGHQGRAADPAGDRLAVVWSLDGGGAVPQRLEYRGQGDGGEPGAGIRLAGPYAQHLEAAGYGDVRLDHPLVRPGPSFAGAVFAGGAGRSIWGHGLLAHPPLPGPVSGDMKQRPRHAGAGVVF